MNKHKEKMRLLKKQNRDSRKNLKRRQKPVSVGTAQESQSEVDESVAPAIESIYEVSSEEENAEGTDTPYWHP